jgi:hypothetical protein
VEVKGCAEEAALTRAVADAGFVAVVMKPIGLPLLGATSGTPVSTTTVQLSVPGMMCMGSCGSKVKKALSGVVGVGGE